MLLLCPHASVADMESRMRRAEPAARVSILDGFDPSGPRRGKRAGGMLNLLSRLLREQAAQDRAEYGIGLATISIVAIVVAIVIAGDVGTLWSRAQKVMDSAAS